MHFDPFKIDSLEGGGYPAAHRNSIEQPKEIPQPPHSTFSSSELFNLRVQARIEAYEKLFKKHPTKYQVQLIKRAISEGRL